MVKLMVIAKPKLGMTHEEFSCYWLTTHAALLEEEVPDGHQGSGF